MLISTSTFANSTLTSSNFTFESPLLLAQSFLRLINFAAILS